MNKFHPNAKMCSGGICIIALIFGNALCYFRDCGTKEVQFSSVNTSIKIMPLSKPDWNGSCSIHTGIWRKDLQQNFHYTYRSVELIPLFYLSLVCETEGIRRTLHRRYFMIKL
jgi:hypothetical protein